MSCDQVMNVDEDSDCNDEDIDKLLESNKVQTTNCHESGDKVMITEISSDNKLKNFETNGCQTSIELQNEWTQTDDNSRNIVNKVKDEKEEEEEVVVEEDNYCGIIYESINDNNNNSNVRQLLIKDDEDISEFIDINSNDNKIEKSNEDNQQNYNYNNHLQTSHDTSHLTIDRPYQRSPVVLDNQFVEQNSFIRLANKSFKCIYNNCNQTLKTNQTLKHHQLRYHPLLWPDMPWQQCRHTGCTFKITKKYEKYLQFIESIDETIDENSLKTDINSLIITKSCSVSLKTLNNTQIFHEFNDLKSIDCQTYVETKDEWTQTDDNLRNINELSNEKIDCNDSSSESDISLDLTNNCFVSLKQLNIYDICNQLNATDDQTNDNLSNNNNNNCLSCGKVKDIDEDSDCGNDEDFDEDLDINKVQTTNCIESVDKVVITKISDAIKLKDLKSIDCQTYVETRDEWIQTDDNSRNINELNFETIGCQTSVELLDEWTQTTDILSNNNGLSRYKEADVNKNSDKHLEINEVTQTNDNSRNIVNEEEDVEKDEKEEEDSDCDIIYDSINDNNTSNIRQPIMNDKDINKLVDINSDNNNKNVKSNEVQEDSNKCSDKENNDLVDENQLPANDCHQNNNNTEDMDQTETSYSLIYLPVISDPTNHNNDITLNMCNKSLKRHQLRYHPILWPDIPWKDCPHNGCTFKSKSNDTIRNHSMKHLKAYKCDDCGQQFNKNYDLTIHQKTHNSDLKIQCQWRECNQLFASNNEMIEHMRTQIQ
ncbi:putative mediator of RNA polymerase II transcription subunit 26 [Oppia nitens]|uniref:putative mediator of RNA polymerase II transcription subunit 26 n=1 Tax=Oppia nitens TaxID=1686743 RepID=UPI0023DB43EA|nr:putative mediator of RNA polymerase II transcription subunit 26 [Oppia nitens]